MAIFNVITKEYEPDIMPFKSSNDTIKSNTDEIKSSQLFIDIS